MTSLQKTIAQVPNKSRMLFAIYGDNGFTPLKLKNTIAANPDLVLHYDGTILNTKNAGTFIGIIGYGRSYSAGNIFMDLGKKLYVQTEGRTDYILTYVQQVKGANAEGVPDNYDIESTTSGNFWICTWAADNDSAAIGVNVVRAG